MYLIKNLGEIFFKCNDLSHFKNNPNNATLFPWIVATNISKY